MANVKLNLKNMSWADLAKTEEFGRVARYKNFIDGEFLTETNKTFRSREKIKIFEIDLITKDKNIEYFWEVKTLQLPVDLEVNSVDTYIQYIKRMFQKHSSATNKAKKQIRRQWKTLQPENTKFGIILIYRFMDYEIFEKYFYDTENDEFRLHHMNIWNVKTNNLTLNLKDMHLNFPKMMLKEATFKKDGFIKYYINKYKTRNMTRANKLPYDSREKLQILKFSKIIQTQSKFIKELKQNEKKV